MSIEEMEADMKLKLEARKAAESLKSQLPPQPTGYRQHVTRVKPDLFHVTWEPNRVDGPMHNYRQIWYEQEKFIKAGLKRQLGVMGKSGSCIADGPFELTDISDPEAKVYMVKLKLHRFSNYVHHELITYWKRGVSMIELTQRIQRAHQLEPTVSGKYDAETGEFLGRVSVRDVGADWQLKWWSEAPSFHITAYWKELNNFSLWLEKEEKAKRI